MRSFISRWIVLWVAILTSLSFLSGDLFQEALVFAQQQVTLTLYVHEGNPQGPVFTGARVTGWDGVGVPFDKTTNASGYVTISGAPGTWHFTASVLNPRYQSNIWDQLTTQTITRHAFLILAQCDPSRAPISMEEAARYALAVRFRADDSAAIIVAIA